MAKAIVRGSWLVSVQVADPDTGKSYRFLLPRERSILFATDAQGNVIAAYRPEEVAIEVR